MEWKNKMNRKNKVVVLMLGIGLLGGTLLLLLPHARKPQSDAEIMNAFLEAAQKAAQHSASASSTSHPAETSKAQTSNEAEAAPPDFPQGNLTDEQYQQAKQQMAMFRSAAQNNPAVKALSSPVSPEYQEQQQAAEKMSEAFTGKIGSMMKTTAQMSAFFDFINAAQAASKSNYGSVMEVENNQRKFLKTYAQEHPDSTWAKETFTAFGSQFRNSPQAWFDQQARTWATMFESGMDPIALLVMKSVMGSFDTVPVEIEQHPELMARLALQLKGLLVESEARLAGSLRTTADPHLREVRDRMAAADRRLAELRMNSTVRERFSQTFTDESAKCIKLKQDLRHEAIRLTGGVRTNQPAVEEVTSKIPKGTALVEYLHYGREPGNNDPIEARYGAVVLKNGEPPVWISLDSGGYVEGLVRRYQEEIRSGGSSTKPDVLVMILQHLRASIWSPLEPALQGVNQVLIAPDSALHLISFATLLNGDKFLAQDYEIRYVASGRDLLRPAAVPVARVMEVYANPDFGGKTAGNGTKNSSLWNLFGTRGADDESRKFISDDFPTLAGTAQEAQEVKQLAEANGFKVNVHEGAAASKPSLLGVQHPYILHLATHGFSFGHMFVGTNNMPGYASTEADNRPNGRASLDECGIALSGANKSMTAWKKAGPLDPATSGLATAAELSGLDLNNTWLATLSACDTGVGGVVDGEDVFAMRRAMLQAGARNVLCTLWRVNDAYTSTFMKKFYTAALASGDAAGALAELQRTELCNAGEGSLRERVRLAGPFVLTSSGRPGAIAHETP